mgnify:CR=1 FL=1
MEGRAKVNLKVEGEVVAKMDFVFEDDEEVISSPEFDEKN